MVEMRNTQAFQIQLGIEDEIFGKVRFEELVILRPENVERQRVAALFDRVDDFLKLSKHGLPEKSASQVVDLPVDDVGTHLRIARCFQQMIGEKLLVKCRCDLGQKNWIFIILKSLRILRKPAMHGMTG